MNWEARARELQRQLDDAEFRLEQMSSALDQHGEPVFAGLTVNEATIAQLLRERSPNVVRKSAIYDLLYSMRHDDEMPEPKIVDVWVYKARKKLDQFGIKIETSWGRGYSMPPEAAEAWDQQADKSSVRS